MRYTFCWCQLGLLQKVLVSTLRNIWRCKSAIEHLIMTGLVINLLFYLFLHVSSWKVIIPTTTQKSVRIINSTSCIVNWNPMVMASRQSKSLLLLSKGKKLSGLVKTDKNLEIFFKSPKRKTRSCVSPFIRRWSAWCTWC